MTSEHCVVNLRVEKELHDFLNTRAVEQGVSIEEYVASIVSKQSNINEMLEDMKTRNNNYTLSRTPYEDDYTSCGMDIGCSTLQAM